MNILIVDDHAIVRAGLRRLLKGLFEGLTNKEIGAHLNISEASVKSALQQLFTKTGVRTRSQLVRVALEEYGDLWGLHP